MCGIAGLISARSDRSSRPVNVMLDALSHRGPDGEGTFADGPLHMGMRRLAIIDPATGWQPLYNEDKTIALVANGEIYNFVELRRGLEARGHVFRTGSDCEVVAHLYEEHGTGFVHHLRGMFAIALWDARRRRLVLVRDRMGEKPLYLAERDGALLFSSELKSILASGEVAPVLDAQAVAEFLHYGFVIEPSTPFQYVRKLPPASMLVIDTQPWQITESVYWSAFDVDPLPDALPRKLMDAIDEVGQLIVRSDMPVGAALSGGVDSSLIACLAGRHMKGKLTAISLGYDNGGATDESGAARWLAEKMGWNFIRAEISDGDAVERFDEVIAARDDPIGDISGVCYHHLNETAREAGIPVMLYGQGGDELFWGYPWVRDAAAANCLIDGSGFGGLQSWIRLLGPSTVAPLELARWAWRDRFGIGTHRRIRNAVGSANGLPVLFGIENGFLDAFDQRRGLFADPFCDSLDEQALLRPCGDRLEELGGELETMRVLFSTYLLQNGMAQGDRLSMCSSVEVRLPLVDYKLVELVVGMTKAQSQFARSPKKLLLDAARELVPAEVFKRPKRGFAPPARRWLSKLQERYAERLVDGYLVSLGILRPEAASELATGRFPYRATFPIHFRPLVLESWLRIAEEWVGAPLSLGGSAPLSASFQTSGAAAAIPGT